MKALLVLTMLFAGEALSQQPREGYGLWDVTGTTHVVGRAATGRDQTAHLRECIATGSIDQDLLARAGALCTRSNVSKSASGISMDLACPGGATGHIDMRTPTPEHTMTVSRMTMNLQGHTTAVESTIDLHLVSRSCGSIKPGQPQLLP